MSLTIESAEDAYLQGRARWQEFREQFEAEWLRPLARRELGLMLATMPPQVRARLSPQALEQAKQLLEQGG
jgi:hypothetical protein